MDADIQMYMSKGVVVNPPNFSVGDKIRILYDGILAKSGAGEIYAHVGYGNKWNNTSDVKMTKTPTGYEATMSVASSDTLCLAFKDGADNWDNNSGINYSFNIV